MSAHVSLGTTLLKGGNKDKEEEEDCCIESVCCAAGIATSSGLAAQNLLCHMLKSGDHVLCMNDLYGGTFRYFNELTTKYGVERSFVDISNLDNLRASLQDNTKVTLSLSPQSRSVFTTGVYNSPSLFI